jgi:LCP family protein required for cell wall assembly
MFTHLQEKEKSEPKGTWRVINIILLTLFAILTGLVIFIMYSYNFLAFRYINIVYTVFLIGIFLISLFLILTKKRKMLTSALLILSSVISIVTLLVFKSAIDMTDKMNKTASYSEIEMSVVVPVSSAITDVSELSSVQAPINSDGNNIEKLLSQIQIDKRVTLSTEEVDSYQTAYENIITGTSQAMVLNSAYSSLLELSYPDYKSNLKTIYSYTIKKKISDDKNASNSNVFNIYISGIDTYGSISTVSRSDVNIILTVNMNTHKILMTTTPRDSYVEIPDGGANQYDKLTHAGIYGVETSQKTLEKLYDIEIDYYARVNFTSFIKLIDAVGGVTVYNDQAFTSYTNKDYSFEVGNVTLSSEAALAFVRERYSLENGDYDRGLNQLKVVRAIINKLSSLKSIGNFSTIFSNLESSVQTNMSLKSMMSIVNEQLSSSSKFKITSQEITGTGSIGELPSYAMPTASLYMIQLEDSNIASASQAIKDIMEGK